MNLLSYSFFILAAVFLAGLFFVTSFIAAIRCTNKKDLLKLFENQKKLFFYKKVHHHFFPKHEFDALFFACIAAQNISGFLFAFFITLFFVQSDQLSVPPFAVSVYGLTLLLGAILFSFFIGDYLPRLFGTRHPEKAIKISAPFSSVFLLIALPLTWLFIKISHMFGRSIFLDKMQEPSTQAKREIIDIIQEAELESDVNLQDKKLIESVLDFRNRIVREIMRPRVDVFSLPDSTTIKEAAWLMEKEGYSRVPIYHNTVDNMTGVLMYKDILFKYQEFEKDKYKPAILEAPIASIQKPVLYTPETKKISNLLQEFRKKQMHFAVVVDEYGGTEGIVTIEDILEEIVGDISDEYDEREEKSYKKIQDNNWLVDARMGILEVEEEFSITIPQDGDYDTLGGYIFSVAGSIPPKGFTIHQDDFEIEVVSSTDRLVEKVMLKIIPKEKTHIKNQDTHFNSKSDNE